MPAPSKPQLDATWLSNHYIEDSKRSYHSCARCIVFFATEASKYLGKWGCIMANLSDNDYKKVSAWRVGEGNDAEQYMRCMRCWNLGQECCSVPDDFDEEMSSINDILQELQLGKLHQDLNPDYQADASDGPNNRKYFNKRKALTPDEIKVLKSDLRDQCAPLRAAIERQYAPHSEHLVLHNGAISSEDSPHSALRPSSRARTKQSTVAKNEANKRLLEEEINQNMVSNKDSPRKRAKAVDSPLKLARAELDTVRAELDVLEAEKAGLPSNKRSSVGKKIIAAKKRIAALEAEV